MTAPENAYEGASTSFRMKHKGIYAGDADRIAERELQFLRARSQHALRNIAVAKTAQTRCVSNWIGTGILGKWDDPELQLLWDEFAKNPSVDRKGSLSNLQTLWGFNLFADGEALSRMIVKRREGVTVPLALQTFSANQLDAGYNVPGKVIAGIAYDRWNAPKKYYLWQKNPRSLLTRGVNKRIPVRAEDMLHIFEQRGAGQNRGIPWLSAAITMLYDLDELQDATLVRQKAAQAIGWIVEKTSPGSVPAFGGVTSLVSQTAEDGQLEENEAPKIQKIIPGGVHYLNEGENFKFATTQDIGDNFVKLIEQYLRSLAGSVDLSYEQLSGNLTNVNFSSIRFGLIEFRKRLEQVQRLVFISRGLQPLADRFKELAGLAVKKDFSEAKILWSLPKLAGVDPYKDILADREELALGLSTLEDKWFERQLDADQMRKKLLEEQNDGLNLSYRQPNNAPAPAGDAQPTGDASPNNQ